METETVETFDQIIYNSAPFEIGVNYYGEFAKYTNTTNGKVFIADYDHDYALNYIVQKIA